MGPGPITRASLGGPGLSFKDAVWDLLCASHTHSELAGQRFRVGEEDTEKWTHFDLAKLEETFNVIVNSKPLPGGWARMLVLCLWSLCNSINIDA